MNCLLCGATGAACGHPYTGRPVDIPREGSKVAEQGPVMRVDRGDGNLINMKAGEAKKFIASNPGAKVVGPRPTHDDSVPTEQEFAATAAQDEDGADDLDSLKKDELVALADERGIDASGTKADIIERLNAAGG